MKFWTRRHFLAVTGTTAAHLLTSRAQKHASFSDLLIKTVEDLKLSPSVGQAYLAV